MSSTAEYYRSEWTDYQRNGSALLPVVNRYLPELASVLDVGCGAGQELRPFIRMASLCCGIDTDPASIVEAVKLYAEAGIEPMPIFRAGSGEFLPFAGKSFDIVICRLALPYMRQKQALSEMARVLKPDGLLIVKIHHARFYLQQLRRMKSLRSVVHALRVLAVGAVFEATGWQPWGLEVAETVHKTRQLLDAQGVRLVEVLDEDGTTPTLVGRKHGLHR